MVSAKSPWFKFNNGVISPRQSSVCDQNSTNPFPCWLDGLFRECGNQKRSAVRLRHYSAFFREASFRVFDRSMQEQELGLVQLAQVILRWAMAERTSPLFGRRVVTITSERQTVSDLEIDPVYFPSVQNFKLIEYTFFSPLSPSSKTLHFSTSQHGHQARVSFDIFQNSRPETPRQPTGNL